MMTQEIERARGEELLRTICGARLSSVQFVLDYLILGFDEKGALTTLVWPEVVNNDLILTFGEPGYRDRLCAFITQVVDDVRIGGDDAMTIRFRGGGLFTIKLQSYAGKGERAIFTAPKNVLFTW
jgi:hypothetical protein